MKNNEWAIDEKLVKAAKNVRSQMWISFFLLSVCGSHLLLSSSATLYFFSLPTLFFFLLFSHSSAPSLASWLRLQTVFFNVAQAVWKLFICSASLVFTSPSTGPWFFSSLGDEMLDSLTGQRPLFWIWFILHMEQRRIWTIGRPGCIFLDTAQEISTPYKMHNMEVEQISRESAATSVCKIRAGKELWRCLLTSIQKRKKKDPLENCGFQNSPQRSKFSFLSSHFSWLSVLPGTLKFCIVLLHWWSSRSLWNHLHHRERR